MTDKEIIINGVDVSKCYKLIVNQLYGYACSCEEGTHIISSCKNRHNCYYKQLARKTQECEELHTELKFKVEYIQEQREVIKDLEKKLKISIQALEELEMTEKFDHYRKALDEIERICLEDVRIFADRTELRYDSLDAILDIINKLKGGNDE